MSAKQLRLLPAPKPLTERLGAEFFRDLPEKPGVYFMFDGQRRLLYVGQSQNLRDRLNSYRHVDPERDSRKTIRLVHCVERIEFEICASPEKAIQRENELLRTLRPKFNRANTYPKSCFFIGLRFEDEGVVLVLTRDTDFEGSLFGAFKASTSFAFASLVRLLFIATHNPDSIDRFPRGLIRQPVAREQSLKVPAHVAEQLVKFLEGKSDGLVRWLVDVCSEVEMKTAFEQNLMLADLVVLEEFFHRGPEFVLKLRKKHGIEKEWLEPEQVSDLATH